MNQGIIDVAPCVNSPAEYRVGDTDAWIFNNYQRYFFSNITSTVVN